MKSILFIICISLLGCNENLPKGTYTVKSIHEGEAVIDGNSNDEVWAMGNTVTEFVMPWNDEEVPATKFTSFHNGQYFYFLFEVVDSDVQLKDEWTGERDILNEDRVEIFMSADDSLKIYYGLEMDAGGRLLDYKGTYYRKSDWEWETPGLELAATTTEEGYIVEGRIPLAELRDMGVIKKDGMAMMGLYRGEFRISNGERVTRWISWVNPKTPKPDFHVPSSFGKFYFE